MLKKMKHPFFRKLVRECLNEWVDHQKSIVKWDDLSRSVKNDITENIYSNNNYVKNAYWSPESLRDNIDDALTQPMFEVGQGDVDELYNQLTQIGWGIYEKNVGFLMKVIKSGKSLDPVILNNNKFFDGGHRLTAYKRLRKKTIPTIDIGFLLDFDWESWDNGGKQFLDKGIMDESSYTNTHDDSFWGDIGCGILPIAKKTGKILVALRGKYVNEPNTWGVIGGAVDDVDEDIKKTAKREFHEETQYKGDIQLIPAYVLETPNKTFKYHNFIGIIPDEFNPTTDWETERFEWVCYDELISLSKKHFGLTNLLKDKKSLEIIKKYSSNSCLNESSEKRILKETLLPEEYHATHLPNIIDILKTNTINLSAAFVSIADNKGGKPFFLSLSRTKSPKLSYGQKYVYGQNHHTGFGRIVFDGRKLNNNFKSIPVDYWQDSGKGSSFEYEDRIITDKPYIKNIRNYILGIEIMTAYREHEVEYISKIMDLGKQHNIPIYVYDNINNMVKKTNTVNHKIKVDTEKNNEPRESTRDINYEVFVSILLYDYDKYLKPLNGYDVLMGDINEFVSRHNISMNKNVTNYRIHEIMRAMSHYSYENYLSELSNNILQFFKSGSHGPFREHVQLLLKDMKFYGTKTLSDYFKVKIEGRKPASEKKDYINSFKIKRLIGDTYKDVGHEKLDSTIRFNVTTYKYGGVFDSNDFNEYITQRNTGGTLNDFLNYLLNKYTFKKTTSIIDDAGYDNTTNTSYYKLEKTGRNV